MKYPFKSSAGEDDESLGSCDKSVVVQQDHVSSSSDIEIGGYEDVRNEDILQRSLSKRVVTLVAIAGAIGSGLFMSTGVALTKGGPASLLICYSIIGALVYLMMLALGEMATFMPVAGSFCTYNARFVDQSVGFALFWNYWFNDAVSTASDLVALQLVFDYWTINVPFWAISLIFWVFLFAINIVSVKVYGELEYWLGLLKVIAIVIFIILGICVNAGANTDKEYLGFQYWHIDGAPFVNGFRGFASIFVTAAFAYGGTESIGITAGETRNPVRNMPRVVRTVFYRIIFFYLLTVLIIGINVPYNYPNLATKSTATSPFTIVFQKAGSRAGGSFINAVIVTSLISAGNHALYAGTRLLYSLSKQRYAPQLFSKLTPNKVPWVALTATWLVSGLCFGSSFIGTGVLWNWLQNLVGVSNQISWLFIGVAAIRFRKGMEAQGKVHEIKYRNWTHPYGPWVVVVGSVVIILVQGWTAFSPFNVSEFFSYYVELIVFPVLFIGWKVVKRTKFERASTMDLVTDVYHETKEDVESNERLAGLSRRQRFFHGIKSCFI